MDSNDQESNKQITITITKNHYEKIVRGFHVYFPKSVTTFNGTNVHESDDYFEMDYIIYTRDNIKLKINIFYLPSQKFRFKFKLKIYHKGVKMKSL